MLLLAAAAVAGCRWGRRLGVRGELHQGVGTRRRKSLPLPLDAVVIAAVVAICGGLLLAVAVFRGAAAVRHFCRLLLLLLLRLLHCYYGGRLARRAPRPEDRPRRPQPSCASSRGAALAQQRIRFPGRRYCQRGCSGENLLTADAADAADRPISGGAAGALAARIAVGLLLVRPVLSVAS
jgi:hypothetical protein